MTKLLINARLKYMKITIPIGCEINRINQDIIKIRVPNTKFWALGEKRSDSKWNIFLIDPSTKYKELIKKAMTTKAFAIFSNVVLKTPFPYNGKRAKDKRIVIRFINRLTNK